MGYSDLHGLSTGGVSGPHMIRNGNNVTSLRDVLLDLLVKSTVIAAESEVVKIDSSKDLVTGVDLAISRMIISALLNIIPNICVESEELGVNSNSNLEQYYAAIDDVDGSDNYYRGNGILPYCTCICIFRGRTATGRADGTRVFKDLIAGCCIEHLSGTLFYAEADRGIDILDLNLNTKTISWPEPNYSCDRSTRVLTDLYAGKPRRLVRLFETVWTKDFSSSALHYVLAATGMFDGLVFETYKAHELGLAYIFSEESGRWLSDFSMTRYDEKAYVFSGAYEVLMAQNRNLAEKFTDLIDNQ